MTGEFRYISGSVTVPASSSTSFEILAQAGEVILSCLAVVYFHGDLGSDKVGLKTKSEYHAFMLLTYPKASAFTTKKIVIDDTNGFIGYAYNADSVDKTAYYEIYGIKIN